MSTRPLEGLRVLDLTAALSGPFCTMILADYGAEVIKIEPPDGEMGRSITPINGETGESGFFCNYNRNKKGITLNLKNEKALAMFYELVKTADIVVENYKGGVTKRLKIDYETLREINPRLIYASGSGFGQTGPITHRPCFDVVAQAMGGILNLTGYPDQDPVKVGPSIADHVSGIYIAVGVLLALYHRERTGEGQHVDVAMFDTIFSLLENAIPSYTMAGQEIQRNGNADLAIQPFDVYKCKDGFVTIGVGSNRMYATLCNTIGHPELIDDPRYLNNELRVQNYEPYLKDVITSWCTEYTKSEIEAIMDQAGIPCGPVLTIAEAVHHPQILAREMLVHCNHPTEGDIQIQGCVVKMSKTPGAVTRPAPLLGEHSAEILGLNADEIRQLKEEHAM